MQMLLSEATCCGTSERIVPASSSLRANPRIVAIRLCAPMRIGSACGSSRVELVATKGPSRGAVTPSTNCARLVATVAPGSEARPKARRATPIATATATDCDAKLALRSCSELRVVCWPPPCVFLALCTTLARTLLLRMPAAASCAASRGSTVWYVRKLLSRALASMGRCSEKTCESCATGRADPAPCDGSRGPARVFGGAVTGVRGMRTRRRASRAAAMRVVSSHAASCIASEGGGERAARLARSVSAMIIPSSSSPSSSASSCIFLRCQPDAHVRQRNCQKLQKMSRSAGLTAGPGRPIRNLLKKVLQWEKVEHLCHPWGAHPSLAANGSRVRDPFLRSNSETE